MDSMDSHMCDLVGRQVVARRRIEQSPLSGSPTVPQYHVGTVEDYDGSSGDYLVDFDEPFGVVIASPEDIRAR